MRPVDDVASCCDDDPATETPNEETENELKAILMNTHSSLPLVALVSPG